MNDLIKRAIMIGILMTGGIAMATEPTHEEQIKQMEQELDLLKKKTELLNEQSALEAAQAKRESAELESIKEALGSLKFPEGKKGTIAVAVGDEKIALLRSKRPLLELLDGVAHELVEMCYSFPRYTWERVN